MTNTSDATDDQLIRRALVAYFRTGATPDPAPGRTVLDHSTADGIAPPSRSSVEEHDSHRYVVLREADRVIAVYRVQNRGSLRRMKRPPKELLR